MLRRLALPLLLAACSAPALPPSSPAPASALPVAPPTATTMATHPVDTPDAIARAIVADLAARRFDNAFRRFDSTMAKAVSAPALAEDWRELEAASGAFQAVETIEVTAEGGVPVARVTCRFAYRRKVLRIALDQDRRVAGLFFGPVPREVEDQARALVDRLAHADFAAATTTFDASMKAALPPDKLRETWNVLSWQSGAFAEVRKVELVRSAVLLTSRFGETEVVIKVVYDLRDHVAGLHFLHGAPLPPWKPPPYAKPEAFVERDVTVGSAPALPGLLTLPGGAGPFPVVVLVHGFGPAGHGRDDRAQQALQGHRLGPRPARRRRPPLRQAHPARGGGRGHHQGGGAGRRRRGDRPRDPHPGA